MDFPKWTIATAAAAMRRGEISSVELVRDLAATVAARDGDINAYLTFDEEGALKAAAAADARRAAGEDGPLLGVPVAIKDLINVAGQPCTCASRMLVGYTSPYDATVTARLKAAGAVCAGRVNMDEFAMGSSTENSAFKVTHNPHDLERVPGGSSGGSAAAVAAGEAVCALGTDTGGSIRQPASFCGIVGFKPTYGRVSRYGVTAFASSLDQVGPMTKTVEDAALLMQALAGEDPHDGTTAQEPVPDFAAALQGASLKGMRIGLPKEYFIDGTDPAVTEIVKAAIAKCEAAGAEMVEVSLPHTEYAMAVYYIVAPAEASANLARFDGVRYGHRSAAADDVMSLYCRSRAEGLGQEVKRRIILGTYVLSSGYYDAYYGRAQKVRTLIRRDFSEAFGKVDVLLTPVAPTPAFKIGELQDPLSMYLNDLFTIPASLAGLPAVSVPAGKTAAGLPVGVQFIGAPFADAGVLACARAFEVVNLS